MRPRHFNILSEGERDQQQNHNGSVNELSPSLAAPGAAVPSSAEPESHASAVDTPNPTQSIELITGRPIATFARPRPQSAKG